MGEVEALRACIEARATASGPVHGALFRMILRQRLRGPLVESRLADELDVPRVTVRQALLKLETENLVVRGDNGGFLVRRVTRDEYLASAEVREILECEAAGLAAGRVPIEKIAFVRASMETFWTPAASHEALWRLDDELHDLVGEHCNNPVLASAVRSVRTTIRLYDAQFFERRRPPGRQEATLTEHLAILAALAGGRPDEARKAMHAHIRNVAGKF